MESELHKEGDDLEIWLSFHPVEAFVAVPYEGVWFWIARNDLASRTTLAAVTMLFNFLEGGDKAAPLLTIPTY